MCAAGVQDLSCVVRYVWTYNSCGDVPYVGKTDDNVELNIGRLLSILESRRDQNKQFIACSVPSRNIATGETVSLVTSPNILSAGRLSRPHMRGNWSLTKVKFVCKYFI